MVLSPVIQELAQHIAKCEICRRRMELKDQTLPRCEAGQKLYEATQRTP